ncbi:hypothetical protein DFH06DRAFT_1480543 [Mycena polygramma]|nr:hypothetical protein DFH06DRAFT_1480543 [Mycena polygramma]
MYIHPPPEIWRLVFHFATAAGTSYDVDYLPFEIAQELQETPHSAHQEAQRVQTCLSLLRVSRQWRAAAAEFLYEDVRICDARGLKILLATLREGGAHGYGRYVRRLELPRRRNVTTQSECHISPLPTHPIPSELDTPRLVDLLRLCPNLEILVRPCLRLDAESIILWAGLVGKVCALSLPRLKRAEWHETELDVRFYGLNSKERLKEIVSQAPNLRYLFLSSDRQNSLADLALPSSLRTLRLNSSHFPAMTARKQSPRTRRPCYAPDVRHLVLHTALPSALLDFVAAAGQHVRVIELAFAAQVIFSPNQMLRILTRCPRLEELVYHIGAPEISSFVAGGFECASVKRIRLRIDPTEWSPCKPVLRGQFAILEGRSFPNLQEIILHDPTRWFVRRELGQDLLRRMLRRGCAITYEDGSPVPQPT